MFILLCRRSKRNTFTGLKPGGTGFGKPGPVEEQGWSWSGIGWRPSSYLMSLLVLKIPVMIYRAAGYLVICCLVAKHYKHSAMSACECCLFHGIARMCLYLYFQYYQWVFPEKYLCIYLQKQSYYDSYTCGLYIVYVIYAPIYLGTRQPQ